MAFGSDRKISSRGFTLIETLVGSFIFLLVALSGYRAFAALMDAVIFSQAKIAATSLANESIEIIRNLPYEDVGVESGIPSGKIPRNQTFVKDGYSFDLQTTIRNVDDLFDGTIGGIPNDSSPADYKSADLDITCSNCKIFSPLRFTTLVAPRTLETASNNGALFIQVFDASGLPIPNASLHIVNVQTNPDTIIDELSDNEGWIKIVDAPPGTNAYNILATKEGYSRDETYPPGGAAGPDPLKPDATVVVQEVTQLSLSIDRTSSLNVSSIDQACVISPNVGFSLTGSKLIGAPSVLKYPTQNFTTDASGGYLVSDLEWDNYSVLLTSISYDLAGASLLPSFALNPNENKALNLVTVPHLDKALLVSVKDPNGAAIDGATVRLEKTEFDETKNTNSGACPTPGQVFWNGLPDGEYTLTVSKTGFQTSIITPLNLSLPWQNQIIILSP